MKNVESEALFEARKIKGIPRTERPRCGALTRAGGICRAQALLNAAGQPGRCRMHGGMSTGTRTEEGKAANRRRARAQMLDCWEGLRAAGKTAVELSPDGRERLREAARRTMRMRHRKRQALGWCDWMLTRNADWTRRLWSDERRRVILHPYIQTLKKYGDQAFFELAEVAGFENLRKATDGTDLTAIILARYMPRLDISAAAADLRRGAESK
jgi:hypothetical protein